MDRLRGCRETNKKNTAEPTLAHPRHHWFKSDSKKLDRLHERALRYLYIYIYIYIYLYRIGYSLVDRRIQNMLIIVFKAINNIYPPEYLRDLFRLRDNIKTGLRGV